MTREGPSTVHLREKEPVTLEATVPPTKRVRPPPGYEVELTYAPDLTTWRPHEEAPKKKKVQKTAALEFEVPQHTEEVPRQAAEDGAPQVVRPAGVIYVEPPSYELEYIYVPEFMAREVCTSVPVKQKEPVTREAAVTAIKHAGPRPGYEVDFPYAPYLTYRKPHVDALQWEKTQPLEVSKPGMAEYPKSLEVVRPAGVLYVEPPPYELEYLYVPEFMAREESASVPVKEKEPVTREGAVPTAKRVRPSPGYEVEFPYVPDLTSSRPRVEAHIIRKK
ncbi:hypothetical protein MTO96_009281 [Rhipicephalus appendiculatus]